VELTPGDGQSADDIACWDAQDIGADCTRFARLPPGQYFVATERTDTQPDHPPVPVTISAGETNEFTLPLDRVAPIAGMVVDATGAPVAFANVGVRIAGSRRESPEIPRTGPFVDEQGRFRIANLRAGSYELHCRRQSTRVEAPDTNVRIVISNGRSAYVGVELVAAAGEPPLRWTDVYVRRERLDRASMSPLDAWSDDDAYWRVHSHTWPHTEVQLAAGRYRLHFVVLGQAPVELTVEVAAGDVVNLGDVVIDAGIAAWGRVVSADGRPVSGALVTIADWSDPIHCRETTSAEDGTYRLPHLRAGRVKIRATAPGFVAAEVEDDVSDHSPPLEIRLVRGGTLAVRIVGASGVAVPGATVEIRRSEAALESAPSETAPADVRGAASLRVAPGAYRVSVRGREGSAEAVVTDGGETPVACNVR
jgi:hypothetical protein